MFLERAVVTTIYNLKISLRSIITFALLIKKSFIVTGEKFLLNPFCYLEIFNVKIWQDMVPVMRNGKLVGIVCRADIVQAVAQGHLIIRHWFMEASAPAMKTWAESLEQYQKFMAIGQSYLKPWTDFLEQYQKMTESFFRSYTERSPKE